MVGSHFVVVGSAVGVFFFSYIEFFFTRTLEAVSLAWKPTCNTPPVVVYSIFGAYGFIDCKLGIKIKDFAAFGVLSSIHLIWHLLVCLSPIWWSLECKRSAWKLGEIAENSNFGAFLEYF